MWIGTDDKNAVMIIFIDLCGMDMMYSKLSRPIWCILWIGTDDKRWCHDLIWGALWIGRDVKKYSHDLIWTVMTIGNYLTGRFHEKFELICGYERW
jgi:hypothetical protein